MKNIEEINNSKVKEIIARKKHPEFFPGDIIKVGVKITEGKRDRNHRFGRKNQFQMYYYREIIIKLKTGVYLNLRL